MPPLAYLMYSHTVTTQTEGKLHLVFHILMFCLLPCLFLTKYTKEFSVSCHLLFDLVKHSP